MKTQSRGARTVRCISADVLSQRSDHDNSLLTYFAAAGGGGDGGAVTHGHTAKLLPCGQGPGSHGSHLTPETPSQVKIPRHPPVTHIDLLPSKHPKKLLGVDIMLGSAHPFAGHESVEDEV